MAANRKTGTNAKNGRMNGQWPSGRAVAFSAHIPATAAGIDQSARFTPEHALHLYIGTALTPRIRPAPNEEKSAIWQIDHGLCGRVM